MSIQNDKLKKYITQVLTENLACCKELYNECHRQYCDSLTDFFKDSVKGQLAYKRAEDSKIKYAEAQHMLNLWQNQKYLLT